MLFLHADLLISVLNCPTPLRWQAAFLSSELKYIYNNSFAVLSRVDPDLYRNGKRCFACFYIHKTRDEYVPCGACKMPVHPFCVEAFEKEVSCDLAQASQCSVCVYKAAWTAKKHFRRPQAPVAVAIPVPDQTPVSVPPALASIIGPASASHKASDFQATQAQPLASKASWTHNNAILSSALPCMTCLTCINSRVAYPPVSYSVILPVKARV